MEAFWQQKPGELKVVRGGSPALAGGASVQALLQGLLQPGVIWLSKTALSRARTERALSLMQSLQTPVWPAWDGAMARVFGYGVAAKSFVLSRWPNLFIFRPHKLFMGSRAGTDGEGGSPRLLARSLSAVSSLAIRFPDPISRSDFPVLAMAPRGSKRLDLFIFQLAADPRGPVTHPHPFPSARSRVWLVTVIVPKRVALLCIYIDPNRGHLELWLRYFFFGGGRFYLEEAPEPASARERVRMVERAGFLAAARGDP